MLPIPFAVQQLLAVLAIVIPSAILTPAAALTDSLPGVAATASPSPAGGVPAKQQAAKKRATAPVQAAGVSLPPWQAPQPAHPQNPTNPLANRLWGVYHGPQDQLYNVYESANAQTRAALDTIRVRPRTKWYGNFLADHEIQSRAKDYIVNSQAGNPTTLSQMAVFRMKPWEHDACTRVPTPVEQASYKTWIRNLAAGIGDSPTLIVMQPDGPFLWCVPDIKTTSKLLRFATKTLSNLPNTSVYIDAGAADWCENGRRATAARCAGILKRTGIKWARGFAMDSTHYTGPVDNIRLGSQIVNHLRARGYGEKHFIVDTAKSGQPTNWLDMKPSAPGELKDNARTCSRPGMKRCVTLGIPPTARPGDPQWGLPADVAELAARNVDGFVWFGRPWLYNQADPFVLQRAMDMVRTTPWPEAG
ncbi:glycoside hydrolase family 6 protein [Paenarthrobacter sp. YJN-5]|uniref:glycoside hydrolase family 6 protein n=1 Tax=Paenarthrobacter sp. YJN-5 TaxID=2735316 RepID=UPI00187877CD|nr:glycoside hydrolase family 6 protein [Paenarthrobacter sp. YJN-5]QOT19493.1 hypothetical protein HMI59_22920 [Paenarthrobacter sp. YJN-5]